MAPMKGLTIVHNIYSKLGLRLELFWEAHNVKVGLLQCGDNVLVLATLIHKSSLFHVSLNVQLGAASQVRLEEGNLLVVENRNVIPVSNGVLSLLRGLRGESVHRQRVGDERNTVLGFSGGDVAHNTEQLHLGEFGPDGRGGERSGRGESLEHLEVVVVRVLRVLM